MQQRARTNIIFEEKKAASQKVQQQWSHLCISTNKTSFIKLFVDGLKKKNTEVNYMAKICHMWLAD